MWLPGADVGRSGTSWDDVLSEISSLDLGGKYCAVFGLGDSIGGLLSTQQIKASTDDVYISIYIG